MRRRAKRVESRPQILMDHVIELRNRFFLVAAVLLVASTLAYTFRDVILPVILQPYTAHFGVQHLMYLNPTGGFSFIFLVTLYAGLVVTIPVVVHQAYGFVRPMLPDRARKMTGWLLVASATLLVAGVLFGYFVAVPGALRFLGEFAGDYVDAALTADSYLSFLAAYTLGLGALFQIPLLLFIWHHISPLTPGKLLKSERWVILLTVIAAAIITPTPDPFNLLIVAFPIILIYQFGVIAVLVAIARRKRKPQTVATKQEVRESEVHKPTPVPQPIAPPQPAPVHTRPARAVAQRPMPVRSIDGISTLRSTSPSRDSSEFGNPLSLSRG